MTMVVPAAGATGVRIYLGRSRPSTVSWQGRFLAGVLSLGCLSVLVTACGLTPSIDGFGTHRQLGMAECGFLARTGLPCPACGMTTSFAWFSHGNLVASFYLQPMGMVLAVLCSWCVWAAGYVAVTGQPVFRIFSVIPERFYLVPLLGLAILSWAWKIFIHLHGMDCWR